MEKPFLIKCSSCQWKELSTGLENDLKHLVEISNSCKNCGKKRIWKCPKCGARATQYRIKGNT